MIGTLIHIGFLFCLTTFLIILTIIFWYFIWLRNVGLTIPKYPPPIFVRNMIVIKIKEFLEVIKTLFPILAGLNNNYWIEVCGFEGYIYLYFIKKIFILLFIFQVFSILGIPYLLLTVDKTPVFSKFVETNNSFYNNYQIIYFCINTTIFLGFIFKLKEGIYSELKAFIIKKNNSFIYSKSKLDWLQLRTIQLTGFHINDIRGSEGLKEIQEFLNIYNKGLILNTVLIPDYKEMLNLEIIKNNIEEKKDFFENSHKLSCCSCCCFENKSSDKIYRRELSKVEEKLQNFILNPNTSFCGQIFICVESFSAMHFIENIFKGENSSFFYSCFTKITKRLKKKTQFQNLEEEDKKIIAKKIKGIFVKIFQQFFGLIWVIMLLRKKF